jgi:Na+/melibiose symporter-like transporter
MGRLISTVAILAISVFAMPIVMAAGWLNAAIIFVAVGLILMIPINIAAKERFVQKSENTITLKAIFSYLVRNKMLLIFVLGNTVCGATMVVTTMGNYAAKWLFGGEQMIAILNLTSMVPMLLCAILVPILNKWIGKIQLYLGGIIIMVIFGIIGYFVGYSNMTIFLALLAVRGFGYGVLVTVPFMMVADCVEYGNYKKEILIGNLLQKL